MTGPSAAYKFARVTFRQGIALPSRRTRVSVLARQSRTGWRQWVALFALLAFAFQAQITQTHIHISPASGIAMADKSAHRIAPAKNDSGSCPICQAVLHSGQFVSPSAVAMALPTVAVAFIPLAIAAKAARETVSHSWQGRAPPRA